MKKLYIFFIAVWIALFSVSCNTAGKITADDKLTPEEYQQLLEKCRNFIMVAPHMKRIALSSKDKAFIKTHKPKFKPYYNGFKSGKFRMSWQINPGYSVRIYGKGEFLEPSCKLRLSILKFAESAE
jgi:hypothetical protein